MATVYRLVGAHVGVVFERGVHTAFAAQPRGVEEAEFFAAELDHGVDYVARRAGYVADHRALLSGECVEQARLAYVRAADERHADFVRVFVKFVVLELRGYDVHQLVEAGVVLGADADDFVEAEAVGLAYHRVFEVLAVELVHRYDYRLAAPAQLVRYLRVGRRHAGLSVDDEDYHAAFVDGKVHLFFYQIHEGMLRFGTDSSRVHYIKFLAGPLGFAVEPVSRDAGLVVHYRGPFPQYPVEY